MNSYSSLKQFILDEMQMQHIYQPVMLIELLQSGGKASTQQIASAILNRDPSQIEYYAEVVKRMPGKVLTQNRKITTKEGKDYLLQLDNPLSDAERQELVSLCESKIAEYEAKRLGAHWEHRRRNRQPGSGTVRYEVLKRAQGRCELCGCSFEERALEVDHIEPRSIFGKNDISNYQALCWLCNANKGNRDSTDLRPVRHQYSHREEGCLFCELQERNPDRVEAENSLVYAVFDGFAVTEHHMLFIPKRHVADYFGLSQPEINAINQLMSQQKDILQKKDSSIEGFNIGMNCGTTAGQTVMHCHVHLIPRRRGDVDDPRGGIRHVIPGKGRYA